MPHLTRVDATADEVVTGRFDVGDNQRPLGRCQLTPYSRPLVSRIGGHPFSLEGGHPFSGERGPVVFTRSGATRLRPIGGHLPTCRSPQGRVLLSPLEGGDLGRKESGRVGDS